MAEVVGVVASALQFLSAANTCLTIFQEIKKNTPESQRILHIRLETEALKFGEWCTILGIQDMTATSKPDEWSGSPEFTQFQDGLQTMLRFNNPRAAGMVIQALHDMESIMQKARMKLIASASDLPPPPSPRTTRSINRIFRSRRLRKVPNTSDQLTSVEGTASTSSLDLRSRASGLFANMKWLVIDQKLFMHLLDDIAVSNNCLATLLSDSARAKIDRRVQSNMLRNPEIRCDNVDELLPGHSEVLRLAKIQQEAIEEERRSVETQGENGDISIQNQHRIVEKPPILDISDFKPGTLDVGPLRSLSFSNWPVLVEWTHYGKSIQIDHFYRRGHLLSLLSDDGLYRNFKTLQPRGVVIDSKNSRIGLVFQLPNGLKPPSQERTLRDMIETYHLPLGQRFAIARILANAVFKLQSVNWLHKSIRSDNILYFDEQVKISGLQPSSSRNMESGFTNEPATTSLSNPFHINKQQSKTAILESLIAEPRPLPELYLLGWNLSRPDDPSELSESIPISTKGYKATKELIRLYSHPDILPNTTSSPRVRYKLQYDIYSFGLVLLEIGLWETLSFLRKRCVSDDQFHSKVAQEYCDMLLPKMGETYWRAAKRCLCNVFDRKSPTGLTATEENEEQSLSVAFERQVVSELENCSA